MIKYILSLFNLTLHKEYWVNRMGWCNKWTILEYKLKYTRVAYMIVKDTYESKRVVRVEDKTFQNLLD